MKYNLTCFGKSRIKKYETRQKGYRNPNRLTQKPSWYKGIDKQNDFMALGILVGTVRLFYDKRSMFDVFMRENKIHFD